MSLDTTAMVVKLHISAWKGRMTDKTVTESTNAAHGAADGAGHYNKNLISKTKMREMVSAESAARAFHMTQTLPWKDGGERLLPAKNFQRYSKGMRDKKQEFAVAVQKFINQYPILMQDARHELGQMYNPNEYPAAADIDALFNFYTDIQPVPTAGDFRVELNQHEVTKIKKDIEKSNEEQQAKAMESIWHRLHTRVKEMAEGMKDIVDEKGVVTKRGRVYDTYVKNLAELTEILPDLNITEDENLNNMAQEIKDALTAHTPGQLRKDAQLKNDVAATAEDIMDKMNGYMGAGNVK